MSDESLKERLEQKLYDDIYGDPNYARVQMACPEITIEDVDQGLYMKLLNELLEAGGKIDGAQASIEGCEFDWNYDAAAATLHVTCTKKPLLAGCGLVESKIRDLVQKARTSI